MSSPPFYCQPPHLPSLATDVFNSPNHGAVVAQLRPVPDPLQLSSMPFRWNSFSNCTSQHSEIIMAPASLPLAECAASLSKPVVMHAGCAASLMHLPRLSTCLCPAGCAASLTKLAHADSRTAQQSVFSEFGRAVLNSLIYLLKDSLERLQDVHSIEKSKQDTEAWQRQPPG